MRFVTALLLLVSVLATHAAALERAAGNTLSCTVTTIEATAAPALPDMSQIVKTGDRIDDTAQAASEVQAGPCHGHGDCVFLMPQHRLAASTLIPAEADAPPCHARAHHGRLPNKPPIA
jgi:hypothetical protein